MRRGDPKYCSADISEAGRIGWRARVGLEQGIKDYVRFYKNIK
jgi:nucleoside-diphosphate-sugar epimerase